MSRPAAPGLDGASTLTKPVVGVPADAGASEGKTTVLVIDDNPANLRVLSDHLKQAGYRVLVAQDGAGGIDKARRGRPDLIVLDVMMPDMDGFETCRRLKSEAALHGIPVIFATALTDIESKLRGFAAGGVDYVTKPFQQEEVLARVRAHLAVRALHQELEARNAQLEKTHLELLRVNAELTRATEQEIYKLAFFDPLTNLPNRRLLLDRLQQSMAASARSGKHRALFFLDLDNFKELNDTAGHDIGDRLLVEVGRRLRACVREVDTVCRIGGDEFVVLVEQLHEDRTIASDQTAAIADKMMAAITTPVPVGRDEYQGTASIGLILFVGNETSVDETLKRADLAMYQAKAAGRNTWRAFEPAMQDTLSARAAILNDLRVAVVENQFALHYQPQVDANQCCTGAEALIRWTSPHRGPVACGDFIPFAEESGLIGVIGAWVLKTACERLAEWQRRPETAHLTLSVNVSPWQFKQVDFVEETTRLVREWGVPPDRLKLEITESLLIDNIESTVAKMAALRSVGLSFALDDFGTGYSSLSYVKRFPFSELKIDQSFLREVPQDRSNVAICRAIIALGQSLGLSVVAEGVESEAQWQFLLEEGCNSAQGYHFARPMPPEDFERWLRRPRAVRALPPR
ncbi:MAG TPA: EAL domain-containing protein [Rubrivivax sp.]|nr:EAL domain-containing protein [Rubrivivax sp.]